jgi:hypothetical protein
MNFILNKEYFDIDNVCFLETKNNIVMENGNFTKMIYSTSEFILNNIFIDFEIIVKDIHQINNEYSFGNGGKYIMYFDLNNENVRTFKKIMDIEKQILEYYLKYRNIEKKCEYILKNQIMNKNLKFYKSTNSEENLFYLKISGVWENNLQIGITYKVLEYSNG